MAKYITVIEAAKLANRHRQSVYNAVEAGLIRSKKQGGQLLILAADILSAEKRRVWRRKNKSAGSVELS